MEVQEADEFQVFFPGDEARFFPEFPDGALQEVFTGFDFTAEAVPFADAEAAFFCGLIKVSRPGGRESKVS